MKVGTTAAARTGRIGRAAALLCVTAMLIACSGPRDKTLPTDLSKLAEIQPLLEKLTPEERELVGGYVLRKTFGAALRKGLGAASSPDAGDALGQPITIGAAIEDQRKWKANQALEEAKKLVEQARIKAEHDAAVKAMADAVQVTLVSKKITEERGYSGMLMDERIQVIFMYSNKTTKDISGVKGLVTIKDVFGDAVSAFLISNDDTIKAGQGNTWTGGRSIKYSMGSNKDRKLAELPFEKLTVVWEPQVIAFSDGTSMKAAD